MPNNSPTLTEVGFYKNDSGLLLHAPNFVKNSGYTLLIADQGTYSYPVDGWNYYTTRQLALDDYGITDPEEPE